MAEHDETVESILDSKIIAVLRTPDPADALELVRAYADGGIGAIELTTSIPSWESVLTEAQHLLEGHDTVVGLGTVTSSEIAQQAIDLGARFIVSPMTVPDVISTCLATGTPVIPGALTATEISNAAAAGATFVKVFPITAVGGPAYLKAILAPLPHLKMVASGGTTPQTAIDYLRAGAVAVGIGSNLAPKEALEKKDWHQVTTSVQDLLSSIRLALSEDSK